LFFFFFNDAATTEIYTLSLHDALPICGAGVAAIGAGATMILWGRKDNTALSNCTPWCSTQSLDHVKKMYLLGDISLGVGVAALAASYWVYAATRHSGGEEGPAEQAHLFDVQPTKSGAIA